MSIESKVFELLSTKIELVSQKIEFGIIQDAVKSSQDAIKEFQIASSIISGARSKADVNLKKSISLANTFLSSVNQIKNTAKEFGINVPEEILREERFANATIISSQNLLRVLNQLESE